MSKLTTSIVASALSILAASTAAAQPPFTIFQDRQVGNQASGNGCLELQNGSICLNLSANESYTVKGLYEFTEIALFESGTVDGGYFFRWMRCYVPEGSLKLTNSGATLEAMPDAESTDCVTIGFSCDASGVCGNFPFSGVTPVYGTFRDPASQTRGTSHLVWNDQTGTSGTNHCSTFVGYGVQTGYFTITSNTLVFGDPGVFGSFSQIACNRAEK